MGVMLLLTAVGAQLLRVLLELFWLRTYEPVRTRETGSRCAGIDHSRRGDYFFQFLPEGSQAGAQVIPHVMFDCRLGRELALSDCLTRCDVGRPGLPMKPVQDAMATRRDTESILSVR